MRILIDRSSAVPIGRQIADHIRQTITSGVLPPGTKLPSTRSLAADLGVCRLTVETAYAELRADGLVVSRIGSGNYAQSPIVPVGPARPPGAGWPPWQQPAADDPGVYYAAGIVDAEAEQPAAAKPARPRGSDIIDLSAGTGDPALFPVDALRREIQAVLARDGARALAYADPWGYAPLRRAIAGLLASDGIEAGPESILVTSGSQQAIALAAQALARPGETVLAESPTYSGALQLFRSLGLIVASVPTDDRGMQVELLEGALRRHRPKLVYTMPTFSNPAGTLMGNDRRAHLLEVATRHQVPVIEDDYIGDLRYEGQGQPALRALDRDGVVLYTSTFSKMLMPGFRVGFIAASGPIGARLAGLKSALDLATSNLAQRALEGFVTIGRYREHVERSRRVYRRRRDEAARAVRSCLPGCSFELPRGGLFLWLRLPHGLACDTLLSRAQAAGVAFMPGTRFFAEPEQGTAYLRLNFASNPADRVSEGIRRLGQVVADFASPPVPRRPTTDPDSIGNPDLR
jgi:GntR family transcriptional regulator/MocR family aminotransferase